MQILNHGVIKLSLNLGKYYRLDSANFSLYSAKCADYLMNFEQLGFIELAIMEIVLNNII